MTALDALLEGFSEDLHPRGFGGRWIKGDKVHVVTPQGHVERGVVEKPAESYDAITSRGTERATTVQVRWHDGDVTHERSQDLSAGHPADRHGGFGLGDHVTYREPSIVNGRVEGHGPPKHGDVVGLQRNGYLRVREPAHGTTVDVHHSNVTKAARVLDLKRLQHSDGASVLGALLERG